jgi:hypothetical protein
LWTSLQEQNTLSLSGKSDKRSLIAVSVMVLLMVICASSQALNLREAPVRHFEAGPLHQNLEKEFK